MAADFVMTRPPVARFLEETQGMEPAVCHLQVIFIVINGRSDSLFSRLSLIEYHSTVNNAYCMGLDNMDSVLSLP